MSSKQDWKKLKQEDTFMTGEPVEATPQNTQAKSPDQGEEREEETVQTIPPRDPAEEALERRKQQVSNELLQAELFEKYLEDTGLSKAFQLVFAEIISKKVPAEHVFTYTAMRLRNIGAELDALAKRKT